MSEIDILREMVNRVIDRIDNLEVMLNQHEESIDILNQSIIADRQIISSIKELKESHIELSRQIIDVEKSMIDVIKERITDALPELMEYKTSIESIEVNTDEESNSEKELNLL